LRTSEQPGSLLHAEMRSANLGEEPWTLSLPAEQALLDRLAAAHRDLGEVTANQVFQGLITGAEDIYRCVDAGPHPSDATLRLVRPNARPDAAPIAVEQEALRRVVAGSNDLKRFRFDRSPQWIIFPYERDQDADPYRIVTATRMQTIWPCAFAWLDQHKTALQDRSPQSATQPWNDENWPAYSRRQNLERFAQPKVLVPYMVKDLNATVDATGDAGYFVNVTTGGYGVQLAADATVSMEFMAALLSSELLSWALRRRSRAWRGEWMGARAANLRRLPILEPDTTTQQAVVAAFDRSSAARSWAVRSSPSRRAKHSGWSASRVAANPRWGALQQGRSVCDHPVCAARQSRQAAAHRPFAPHPEYPSDHSRFATRARRGQSNCAKTDAG